MSNNTIVQSDPSFSVNVTLLLSPTSRGWSIKPCVITASPPLLCHSYVFPYYWSLVHRGCDTDALLLEVFREEIGNSWLLQHWCRHAVVQIRRCIMFNREICKTIIRLNHSSWTSSLKYQPNPTVCDVLLFTVVYPCLFGIPRVNVLTVIVFPSLYIHLLFVKAR